jgi:Reverse transcriptase (RNA-dependent DNA polymerase)/RNase H-like domain found in reverse transcriptase/Integrase zinc binding domain/Chromo (CHRromatin Organisation MOdifier) domain/gag-polyprotein putative aspartyl protease
MAHEHSSNRSRLNRFYLSQRETLQTLLHCEFAEGEHDVTKEDGTLKPSFVIVSPGKAEEVLGEFLRAQTRNPQLSACFLMGEKAAKAKAVYTLTKGMKVVGQGKQGKETPYSFVIFHAPPKYHISLAQAFGYKTLQMVFNVGVGGLWGSALMDTGATHSFVRKSFLNTLGVQATPEKVNIQLADGQTMQTAGTARLRVQLSAHCHDHRNFIVTDTLLDGVDLILGQDFLKSRGVVLNYGDNVCYIKAHHHYITLSNAPPYFWGNRQRGPPKVISAARAIRDLGKGAQAFWGLVRESGENRATEGTPPNNPQVASTGEPPNPWEEDILGATGLLNENSQHAIEGMIDKPDSLRALLLDFIDRFPEKLPNLPPVREVSHTIPMEPGHKPPCRPTYRLSHLELEECKKQVEELLQQGLIRPSASPYGSPILFVRKKEGTFRMVIDYRQINNLTVKDKYPLPRIDDLLDKLQGATYFSSFDLLSGYHQVRLSETDVPKTAFRTPFGSYEFLVLPFGLTNAPATFQRLMNTIFHDFVREGFVVVYLDDLLVFSKSESDHMEHLQRVLHRLREHDLYAKLLKCHFFTSELKYLGHLVGKDGLKPDPEKIEVIRTWPKPTNVQQVRQFLGLANYFRKFIARYSIIAAPLTSLTSSKRPWTWGEREQQAFDRIKTALTSAPVLALPDVSKTFQIEVISDASDVGVGAILLQDGRPIAYFSKKLNDAERNYSTTEKELAGVMYALKEWRCYLLGKSFKVITDHKSNSFLQEQSTLTPRRARWAEFLQNFSIEWIWSPGRTNPADPLSRHPQFTGTSGTDGVVEAMGVGVSAGAIALPSVSREGEVWLDRVREASLVDPWLHRRQNRRKVTRKNGLWLKGSRIYVPMHHVDRGGEEYNLRREVLENLHGPPVVGHPGRDRTLELVSRSWWWPGISEDVKDFVRHCDSCQRVKASTQLPAGLLHPLEIPARKWQSISMDLITGLPRTKSGQDAIWVVVDRLSKCAHFAAIESEADALDIANLLRTRVFTLHGFPDEIVSDRDPRWVNKFCTELFRLTGCRSALSTAFHPQTDGQTERVNRVLEDYLRHYVTGRHNDWDLHLCEAEFVYNNTYQVSINSTPFRLTFGQDPKIPFQEVLASRMTMRLQNHEYVPAAHEFARRMRFDLERARVNLKAAQDRMKAYADRLRSDGPSFVIGQQVLLSSKNLKFKHTRTRKLLPRYVGPFEVVKVVSPVAYKLRLPKTMKVHDVFHVSLLKPYRTDGSVQPPPPPEVIDGELEYEVEAVLAHREKKGRGLRGRREYLIKWVGYDDIHNTWEPEDNLEHAREALQTYWDNHGVRAKDKVETTRRKRKKLA